MFGSLSPFHCMDCYLYISFPPTFEGLSIHRIKRGDASDESYFREVQTLQMELQQIMKGDLLTSHRIVNEIKHCT